VSLTGLGVPAFETNIKGLKNIYSTFARYIAIDKLAPCGIVDEYDKYTSIELSNRYFTPKRDALVEEQIPITADIDPAGLLRLAGGSKYVHTNHNAVRYYMRTKQPDGKDRLVGKDHNTVTKVDRMQVHHHCTCHLSRGRHC
jgi:hypothetical protein